jgi:hypothetical protein
MSSKAHNDHQPSSTTNNLKINAKMKPKETRTRDKAK